MLFGPRSLGQLDERCCVERGDAEDPGDRLFMEAGFEFEVLVRIAVPILGTDVLVEVPRDLAVPIGLGRAVRSHVFHQVSVYVGADPWR